MVTMSPATKPADDDADADVAQRVLLQEVQIVQSLACNDLNVRNRQLKRLAKWLQLRSRSTFRFTEDDYMRLWKGLYYNMWMSDKPLVQEELAEELAKLLHCFNGDLEASVHFYGAFLRTMCQEWFGIDQWRIDKFMMLTRRMTRSIFGQLKEAAWAPASVRLLGKELAAHVLSSACKAKGFVMHVMDVFFEELAKVADGDIDERQVAMFVKPFVTFYCTQTDSKLMNHCRTRVFFHLLYQSELGREYSEKYHAWRQMGFPTASIDDLVKDENAADYEDEEEVEGEGEEEADAEEEAAQQKHLDPRAGNVDVLMPLLPLNAKDIIDDLEMYLIKRDYNVRLRKVLKNLLQIFKTYQSGVFPLGVKRMPRFEAEKSDKPLMEGKIEQLDDMENEMYGVGRKLKQLNKRKRRKLLKSLNFEEVDESDVDEVIEKALPKEYLQERRKRSQSSMMNGWVEEELEEDLKEQPAIKLKKKQKKKEAKQLKENSVANGHTEKAKPKKKKNKQIAQENPIETPKVAKQLKKTQQQQQPQETEKDTKKSTQSEWNEPLAEGEVEYFLPSRKSKVQKANSKLLPNPLAKKHLIAGTPKKSKSSEAAAAAAVNGNTPKTPASVKRVKIALKNNTAQNPSEYIKQLISSPNLPFDADKKPTKGVLKPNLMPSPINPFYKKKIGLNFLNDTM